MTAKHLVTAIGQCITVNYEEPQNREVAIKLETATGELLLRMQEAAAADLKEKLEALRLPPKLKAVLGA